MIRNGKFLASLSRPLRLAASLLALAALTGGALAAAPQDEIVCTYFNNAQESQVVGVCFDGCTGITCTGTQTPYVHCVDTGRSCQQPGR